MKSQHQIRVENFMRLAKQNVPNRPRLTIDRSTAILRAQLIFEEAMETIAALGVEIVSPEDGALSGDKKSYGWLFDMSQVNIPEVIDGVCDTIYVSTGTASALGWPVEPFQNLIDQNNLDKIGPGSSWSSEGKLIKPSGHKGPDVKGMMNNMLMEDDRYIYDEVVNRITNAMAKHCPDVKYLIEPVAFDTQSLVAEYKIKLGSGVSMGVISNIIMNIEQSVSKKFQPWQVNIFSGVV